MKTLTCISLKPNFLPQIRNKCRLQKYSIFFTPSCCYQPITINFHYFRSYIARKNLPYYVCLSKNFKICVHILARNVFFLNIVTVFKNSLPFKSYCRNNDLRSRFNTFAKQLRIVNNLPLTYFFTPILILRWLIFRYRKNISKPNSWTKC